MYQIGDKVVYPMYGAGEIKDIEEKEILGEKHTYCVFNMTHSNMQVMFPIEKTETLGIREIVDQETLEKALQLLADMEEPDLSVNRHQRFHINKNKMKSGDIFQGVQVIRDLMYFSRNKKISTEDKNMLDNALQILTSELIYVKGFSSEEASEFIDNLIKGE